MHVMVGEHRTVTTHGGFFQDNPVRELAGAQRRVLLGDAALGVHGRVADLEQSLILRVRILVGVERRQRCWSRREELLAHGWGSIGFTVDSMNPISSGV